ncbi:MAG: nucleotidyltransferase domain-containing protein [Gaiellaceae bacterium]
MHPDDAEWAAWTPAEAAQRLAGIDVPWRVSGGWAIDLFLGGERREHDDLELAVPSDRFDEAAAALGELEFYVVTAAIAEPVTTGAELMTTTHQTWGLDPAAGVWRVDIFREPFDEHGWVARRNDTIRLPYDEVILETADGIPYERPEVVLLFKAKHARAKDEADLAAVLPHLSTDRRRLLADWIERVHPGHFWLPDLA